MSPEQVIGASLDGCSDLFSVGIVLAEMLMGRRLFTAPNDIDVLLMVRDGRLERLDKYGKDIPPVVDTILRKSLAKRVGDRYQSAVEFRNALADLLFQMNFRITASDLGVLAKDFFDPNPDALKRVEAHAKRWKIPDRVAQSDSGPENKTGNPAAGHKERPMFPSAGGRPKADGGKAHAVEVEVETLHEAPTSGPHRTRMSPRQDAQLDQLSQALSQPLNLSVVDLEQYAGVDVPSAVAAPEPADPVDIMAPSPTGVSGPPPTKSGNLQMLSPMRMLANLAIASETGLLRVTGMKIIRDIYLVRGVPESLDSSDSTDQFGQYLVARGIVRARDLAMAQDTASRNGVDLQAALVQHKLLRPLDILRLLSQHVREQLMDLFSWEEGTFAYYRGITNLAGGSPLSLDSYEILGAGSLTLSIEFLHRRFGPLQEFRPQPAKLPRIPPDAFKLGPMPRQMWITLNDHYTLREWTNRCATPAERLTFLRMLYLLVETDLAHLG
jgi:serine/threonine-protein kinase